ncbi:MULTISPECIES: hypothetical protein [unclassified Bacillus (in: firmicutes)]|jgi:hypothetical protein|nr:MULTISPECIES: hypothetical protein [unclassified Bacillus (in: firmicutes)]
MAKQKITELVNKLKESGINASLTKPKADYLSNLQHLNNTPSTVHS